MSLNYPRRNVEFEKDPARCPGWGWDLSTLVIPDNFLYSPLDLTKLKNNDIRCCQDVYLRFPRQMFIGGVFPFWRGVYDAQEENEKNGRNC